MTSSTRFDSSSTSEIWSLLNALDDATVRVVATRAALLALQSPAAGMFAYQADYDILWRYTGTQWRHFGEPRFATVAIRDAQIAQPLAGDRCQIVPNSGDVQDWRYDGTYWWQADAPVTAILSASFTIPAGTADVGMQVAVNSPGTSAVWEVALDLDAQVSSAAGSFFVATIVADGATQGGQIIGSTIASHSGARQPFSKRWIVSGIAAGPGKTIKVQAAGGGSAGNWQLNSIHSALIVKRLK